MHLLIVNTGSSSVRLAVFDCGAAGCRVLAQSRLDAPSRAANDLLDEFLPASLPPIDAIAHRVVHGGDRFGSACLIDADTRLAIERLSPLAPLHQPLALRWIDACSARFPSAPQIAVFDTAFFAKMPAVARSYALPAALVQRFGLHRFGFHGLAHQSMWQHWARLHPEREGRGRIITLQLGSGCSISAIEDGQPLDTSMGYSPLEGLVMATRSGDLDPQAVLCLARGLAGGIDEAEDVLTRRSGLLGLSGRSADIGALVDDPAPAARHAVALYCHRARRYIGACAAVLGGVDALVFGGGAGEHVPAIRSGIVAGLDWLDLRIDASANAAAIGREACISPADSTRPIWVIPVDEAAVIADQARDVLPASTGAPR